jgi:ABC-type nickel/cobalt efflux system permease component RcnA
VNSWLEFGVALMIIGLGISALWQATRKNSEVHVHQHSHDGLSHTHIHFHEKETKLDCSKREAPRGKPVASFRASPYRSICKYGDG